MSRRVEWYRGTDVSEALRSETFATCQDAKFRKTRVFINICQKLKFSSVRSSLEIKKEIIVSTYICFDAIIEVKIESRNYLLKLLKCRKCKIF
jgi:hypothetical protein